MNRLSTSMNRRLQCQHMTVANKRDGRVSIPVGNQSASNSSADVGSHNRPGVLESQGDGYLPTRC